ncbi:hypothetical protein CN227_09185 [Sinorhizobium meliloti]|uniref:hypothetical protein n=1 Tax=Rhizobium meliloti TaxID=382 RepID=UPI000FD912EF|nr:hypothetical protein [Sinorhizobium meliloti]RVE81648.1 hypothetical protein CN240_14015 [Sinorhizobium meliloti]RVG46990.1 hypothetical protein CN227_09185 [Sinorhizobium meliloti]
MKYLLQGSLQASGEKLRITAQLIDVTTGGYIWSQRFDRQAEDIFVPIPMKPPLCSEMIAPPVSGMISPPV